LEWRGCGLLAKGIVMKPKELRALSIEELQSKEKTLKEEWYKLNDQRYTGRVEKSNRFSAVKRDIARIQTILTERKETPHG
jgi:large subunit ribosomal protein L29